MAMGRIRSLAVLIENLSFEYPSSSSLPSKKSEPEPNRRSRWIVFGLFDNLDIRALISRFLESLTPKDPKESALKFLRLLLTNILLRGLFGFSLTFLLLFLIVYYQSEVPARTALPISAVFAGVLTIFFTLSKTFRCVLILSIPNFGTQQGRFVLFAIITSILVGGPLTTFSRNLCEFGKSAKCMSLSTLKQGETIMENYGQSYKDVYAYLDYHVERLRVTKEYVDEQLKPIKDAFIGIRKHLGNFEVLLRRSIDDCHVDVEGSRYYCVVAITKAFNSCKNTFLKDLYVDDICELVWTVTDLCEPTLQQEAVCAPLRAAETITAELKSGIKKLEEAFSIETQVVKEFHHKLNHTINATEIELNIRVTFENIIDRVVTGGIVLKYLFLFPICWIPVKSYHFLRKVRRGYTNSPASFLEQFPEYNEHERQRELWSQGFLLLLHILFSLTIFGVDFACYWVQNSVLALGDTGNLTIEHAYNFSFKAKVGQALLLNPIVDFQNEYLNQLNIQTVRNHTFSAASVDCFPKPVESSGLSSLVWVLLMYFLVLIILINGNRILKYRLQIIHFVIPELQQMEDPTLIPYSVPPPV